MGSDSPVTMEWRRGVNGELGTYTFSPKPNMTRTTPGKRTATLVVPLANGVVVQDLGLDSRVIRLRGVLYTKTLNWNDIEILRNNLINGLSTGPGQLHIISSSYHLYYNGQITTDGVQFDEQTRPNIQDYTITIIVPDGAEHSI